MNFNKTKAFRIIYLQSFLAVLVLGCQPRILRAQETAATSQNSPGGSSNNNDTENASRSPEQPSSNAAQPGHQSDPSLQLGVGDLIELTVYDVPELTTKTRISSTGDMYCALIGPTHVAGLTVEEATQLIQQRLSAFVKDPYVTLFVHEYASQGASVLGEVAKPGVYPVLGEQHLYDLLSASGGLTEKAGHSITVTHRSDPDHPVTLPVSRNLSDNPQSNIRIFPRDTIIVRKADIVYVVGDVARPSAVLVDAGGITVLKAIALAGGTSRTAKLSGVKILHKGPSGMIETPIQLGKILQAKAPDLSLQADDILVVPSSAGRMLAGRALEAAMQAATIISVAAL